MSITFGAIGIAANTYYMTSGATNEYITYEVTSAGWSTTPVTTTIYSYADTNVYGYAGTGDVTYGGTYIVNGILSGYGVHVPPETEEQRVAREKAEKDLAERTRKADRRARMLFIKVAGKKAYELIKKKGHYDVIGSSGQRYRLAIGMKVRVMDGNFGDKVLHQLCAYIPEVPQVDTLLAQYLALTSSVGSEEEFKKIAIKHAA